MPHDPKILRTLLESAAPPDLDLAFRAMFGGIMAYADGKVFASLSDVGLALKLSGADQAEMLAIDGAKPLQYEPDAPPSKSYVVLPDAVLADQEALRGWLTRSAAQAKPAAKRQRGSTRSGETR